MNYFLKARLVAMTTVSAIAIGVNGAIANDKPIAFEIDAFVGRSTALSQNNSPLVWFDGGSQTALSVLARPAGTNFNFGLFYQKSEADGIAITSEAPGYNAGSVKRYFDRGSYESKELGFSVGRDYEIGAATSTRLSLGYRRIESMVSNEVGYNKYDSAGDLETTDLFTVSNQQLDGNVLTLGAEVDSQISDRLELYVGAEIGSGSGDWSITSYSGNSSGKTGIDTLDFKAGLGYRLGQKSKVELGIRKSTRKFSDVVVGNGVNRLDDTSVTLGLNVNF